MANMNLLAKILATIMIWHLGHELIDDLSWTWADWQWWVVGMCSWVVINRVAYEYTTRKKEPRALSGDYRPAHMFMDDRENYVVLGRGKVGTRDQD